jgi:hypothetical protein
MLRPDPFPRELEVPPVDLGCPAARPGFPRSPETFPWREKPGLDPAIGGPYPLQIAAADGGGSDSHGLVQELPAIHVVEIIFHPQAIPPDDAPDGSLPAGHEPGQPSLDEVLRAASGFQPFAYGIFPGHGHLG